MAKDKHERSLHVGDEVRVVCVVKAVERTHDGLNVLVMPKEPVTEQGDRSVWLLNSRQMELVHSLGDSMNDVDIKSVLAGGI